MLVTALPEMIVIAAALLNGGKMEHGLLAITRLADVGFLLGVVFVCSGLLWVWERHDAALIVVFSLLGPGAAIAALKLWLLGCGDVPSLRSPSGHAALAVSVYGTLALVLCDGPGRRRHWTALAAAAGLAGAIAASRVVLGYHTVAETALGGAVGALYLAVVLALYRPDRHPLGNRRWIILLGSVALIAAPLLGVHLPLETIIHRLAAALPDVVPVCGSP